MHLIGIFFFIIFSEILYSQVPDNKIEKYKVSWKFPQTNLSSVERLVIKLLLKEIQKTNNQIYFHNKINVTLEKCRFAIHRSYIKFSLLFYFNTGSSQTKKEVTFSSIYKIRGTNKMNNSSKIYNTINIVVLNIANRVIDLLKAKYNLVSEDLEENKENFDQDINKIDSQKPQYSKRKNLLKKDKDKIKNFNDNRKSLLLRSDKVFRDEKERPIKKYNLFSKGFHVDKSSPTKGSAQEMKELLHRSANKFHKGLRSAGELSEAITRTKHLLTQNKSQPLLDHLKV